MTDNPSDPQVVLRPPGEVMRLDRLGSSFPTRLSFMRSLVRALAAEKATVQRRVWELDEHGFGRAVYSVEFAGFTYSLVAFSTPLADDQRTDRVIADAWDSSYVLFDGVPTAADLDRLQTSVPRQEAARFEATDLILSRANRSVRLFDHAVEELSHGRQPDDQMVRSVGYLMRTTAVYGNGKFGIADRDGYSTRQEMDHPFRAELLAVWLIRNFTIELVEHIALRRAPAMAVGLEPRLKRFLGVGNATGLGMAPFLISHPILINNWFQAKEMALAKVRAVEQAEPITRDRFLHLVGRVAVHLDQWQVEDELQMDRIKILRSEWAELATTIDDRWLAAPQPWDRLLAHCERWSLEGQELMVAAVLEPNGELVDGLSCCMSNPLDPSINPTETVGELKAAIDRDWAWALAVDFEDRSESAQFWYVSQDNLEPRIGLRYEEPGAELEQPLDIARRVQRLAASLRAYMASVGSGALEATVADFLFANPDDRYAVGRVQTLSRHPFAEIRGNMIAESCRPIDLLRAKLAFFGASRFDPKSDRWTRVSLYQGAPLAEDIASGCDPDDWWLASLGPEPGLSV